MLLAQTSSHVYRRGAEVLYLCGIVALVIVVPILLGSFVGQVAPHGGYEWKLGLIFVHDRRRC